MFYTAFTFYGSYSFVKETVHVFYVLQVCWITSYDTWLCSILKSNRESTWIKAAIFHSFIPPSLVWFQLDWENGDALTLRILFGDYPTGGNPSKQVQLRFKENFRVVRMSTFPGEFLHFIISLKSPSIPHPCYLVVLFSLAYQTL